MSSNLNLQRLPEVDSESAAAGAIPPVKSEQPTCQSRQLSARSKLCSRLTVQRSAGSSPGVSGGKRRSRSAAVTAYSPSAEASGRAASVPMQPRRRQPEFRRATRRPPLVRGGALFHVTNSGLRRGSGKGSQQHQCASKKQQQVA